MTNLTLQLEQLRREYQNATLDLDSIGTDPIARCEDWIAQAIKTEMPDPTAMTLATVNQNAEPSIRIVLLKGIVDKQFIFYTDYLSRKGLEMEHNPMVAIHFFWPLLERQIIIQGEVYKLPDNASDAYFQERPRESQISAWASAQSHVIVSREALLEKYQNFATQFGQNPIPRPEHWGGYAVSPHYIEFWQGRPQRLHDRIAFELSAEHWQKHRLSP